MFPELNELHTAANGEIAISVSRPGERLLATLGAGPVRGVYFTSTGVMAIVSGNTVYQVKSDFSYAAVGTIQTSVGPVTMADNASQLIIVDTAFGYIVSLSTGVLTRIASDGFHGGYNVYFVDGYFITQVPRTGQMQISALYDGFTWDALDFATAEGSPDAVVAVVVDRRQIWLFGRDTTEIWWNTGATDFPFARIDGAFIEYGCAGPFCAVKMANSIVWLGGGAKGAGIVWQAQGYQPMRVSNHAVEIAIQAAGDVSAATAFSYQQNGHSFFVLNLPNTSTSWVFDVATGQWHERAYLGKAGFERGRPDCYAFGYSTHVVGDYQNGNIYALDLATYTDNGNPLVRLRRGPHISVDMGRMFHESLQLDVESGVGLDGSPAIGADPQLMVRWSDDFGHSWTTERKVALGKIGERRKRVFIRRLGSTRNRVYELKYSDPTPFTLLGAELAVSNGVN